MLPVLKHQHHLEDNVDGSPCNYHDYFGVPLAGGDDERRPARGGLLVDGQLDLARVEVAQDLLQRRHVALGSHVVEHSLLLLLSIPVNLRICH